MTKRLPDLANNRPIDIDIGQIQIISIIIIIIIIIVVAAIIIDIDQIPVSDYPMYRITLRLMV